MTDLDKLKKAFEDVIWMAARYASGRSTYAPSMVREAVNLFKEVDPNWEMRPDNTIMADKCLRMEADNLGADFLLDIYPQPKQDK